MSTTTPQKRRKMLRCKMQQQCSRKCKRMKPAARCNNTCSPDSATPKANTGALGLPLERVGTYHANLLMHTEILSPVTTHTQTFEDSAGDNGAETVFPPPGAGPTATDELDLNCCGDMPRAAKSKPLNAGPIHPGPRESTRNPWQHTRRWDAADCLGDSVSLFLARATQFPQPVPVP